MAYIDTAALDDENEDQGTGGPLVPGGGTSNAAPSAPTAPQAQGAQSKTPGRFADLSEYLRVNQPQEFGSKLAGKIGEDVTQGQQTLDNAETEFKNRADQSTIRDTNNLTGKLDTNPEDINADEFGKIRDATYGGPTNFSDASDLYSQTQGSAGSAVGKANSSKTEGGRFALLDNYFGRPTYNQGQKSLDNLLVQNDPNSQQAFDQMRSNAQSLQSNVNKAGVDLSGYGSQAKATTEGTRKSARDAIGINDAGNATGSGAYGTNKGALDTAAQGYNSEIERVRALADAGKYNDINPELGSFLQSIQGYGTKAGDYLNVGTTPATSASIATPEQLARMRALSQLAGQEDAFSGEDAGTMAGQNPYSFDQAGYQGQATRNQADFTRQKDTIEPQIDNWKKVLAENEQSIKDKGPVEGNAGNVAMVQRAKDQIDALTRQMSDLYSQYDLGAYAPSLGTIRTGPQL